MAPPVRLRGSPLVIQSGATCAPEGSIKVGPKMESVLSARLQSPLSMSSISHGWSPSSYLCFPSLVSRTSPSLDLPPTLVLLPSFWPFKTECPRVNLWSSYHFYQHLPPLTSHPISWLKSYLYANHSPTSFSKTSNFCIKLLVLYVHLDILETWPTFPKLNSSFPISAKGQVSPSSSNSSLSLELYIQSINLIANLHHVSRTQPIFTSSVWATILLHPVTARACSLSPCSALQPPTVCAQQTSRMIL